MANPNALPVFEPYRWGTIFGILSLDIARPFIKDMGLQLPPGESFFIGLRDIIQKFRTIQSQKSGEQRAFAQTVYEWVLKTYGAGAAQHLYRWGQDVFQYGGSDGVSAFLWNNIVRRGGEEGTRDVSAVPELIRTLRAKLASRTAHPIGHTMPDTAWDREFYSRQGYDEAMNPMEWVRSTMAYFDFATAWQESLGAAGPGVNLDETFRWGLGVAKRMGMPLNRIEKPGSWPALPPAWSDSQSQ
jgi:hypothetical protein